MKELFLLIESCSAFASVRPTCMPVPLEPGREEGRVPQGSARCREARGHCRGG